MIDYKTGNLIGACTDELLLEALKAIKNDETLRAYDTGICSGLDSYFRRMGCFTSSTESCEMRHLMSLWPKFSGRAFYPVPSVDPSGSPDGIYHACRDMWNQETEYGKLRWELLEFCIQRLEDRIYEDKVS